MCAPSLLGASARTQGGGAHALTEPSPPLDPYAGGASDSCEVGRVLVGGGGAAAETPRPDGGDAGPPGAAPSGAEARQRLDIPPASAHDVVAAQLGAAHDSSRWVAVGKGKRVVCAAAFAEAPLSRAGSLGGPGRYAPLAPVLCAPVASVSGEVSERGGGRARGSASALEGAAGGIGGAECEDGGTPATGGEAALSAADGRSGVEQAAGELTEGAAGAAEAMAGGVHARKAPGSWSMRRRKRLGPIEAHVRFLQYVFRQTTAARPGCWSRGGMAGLWPIFRPRPRYACDGGRNLASVREREEQASRAQDLLDWYSLYVDLLRRLQSGRTPTSLELFCGAGGKSEGVRRARGASHGVDLRPQPDYVRRFGAETFTLGDATSGVLAKRLLRKARADVVGASPPCQALSTSRMRGEASEPDLLAEVRALLRALGKPWAMENVLGASAQMPTAVLLRGAMFGLAVDRPRLFEASFPLHVDRVLLEGARRLRARSCLGARNRWRRVDTFGRPEEGACCAGNLFAVQGDKPWRCTREECAHAMGLDTDHMSYVGMSQATPPAYGSLVFAQSCMQVCVEEYGAPRWSYDDFEADPRGARRSMGAWLRGAGSAEGEAALEFGAGRAEGASPVVGGAHRRLPTPTSEPAYAPPKGGDNDIPEAPTEALVREAEIHELFFSHAGDFDQQLRGGRDSDVVDDLCANTQVHEESDPWLGHSTFISVGRDRLRSMLPALIRVGQSGGDERVTVVTEDRLSEKRLTAAGFQEVRRVKRGTPCYATAESGAWAWRAAVMLVGGRRRDADARDAVDFDAAEKHMDARDLVADPDETYTKAMRAYMPIGVDPSRWQGLRMAEDLSEMMQGSGAVIRPEVEPGFAEHPFYPARDPVGLMKSITEVDRALITGSMEYVPADQIARVSRESVIHPWTMADQGGGKWRACQDYSCGTNRYVRSAPFGLPEVWDVSRVVGPESHFAKYDIRDGFWHCGVDVASRHRLVLRHPGNGRLVWSTRLPFGYVDSPRLFCGVTEAVAQAVRARAASAGVGVHVFVFVDDYLVVGDDEALTRLGCDWLEEELRRRGLEWAPHKQRGPCRCIEFLGLMLCNFEGCRCVTVSRKRLRKTQEDLEKWMRLRPRDEGEVPVDTQELAQLLGRLVFFSQVVRGGRTYMQGMLASFKGLVVDWRRHRVSVAGSRQWSQMTVGPAFWRDLQWWVDHVALRHSVPLEPPRAGEAALTGTDASGWGTGQVAWLDGGREEVVFKFTAAEKRRPINWRELLGVVRVVERFGCRLAGRRVLVETDNMAAKGAAIKGASKAADMQELVRRLLRGCERWRIELKVTHTPGEKLDRPDQTSRGDPLEEPRVRVAPALFGLLERRWGPFDSLLGPERAFAHAAPPSSISRLWAHPTRRTAGSGLRLVGERLSNGAGRANALVVVPSPPAPAWEGLLRHGTRVGEVPGEGGEGREAYSPSGWLPVSSLPHALLYAFPRAAGGYCAPVRLLPGAEPRGRSLGYTPHPAGAARAAYLPLPPGAYVYSVGRGGEAGSLCRVFEAYDLATGGPAVEEAVLVQELVRLPRNHRRCRGQRLDVFEGPVRARRWLRDSMELFTADHLVTETERSASGGTVYVSFDWKRAEEEARAVPEQGAEVEGAASEGWQMVDAESPEGGDALEQAREQLHSLNLRASAPTRGGEGVVRERVRVLEALAGGPAGRSDGPCRQPSPYDGILCRGCAESIPAGSVMVSVGDGVTHDREDCQRAAQEVVAREAAEAERARMAEDSTGTTPASASRRPRRRGDAPKLVFFAVRGGTTTGLFTDRAAASEAAGGLQGVRGFATLAGAREFLGQSVSGSSTQPHSSLVAMPEDTARAVPGGATVGSIQRRAQAAEKLSDPRMLRITQCIAGVCEHRRNPMVEAPTLCRGNCGRSLHMLSCAEVGRGYAALGAFTCQHCRGRRLMAVGRPTPAVLARAAKTMVLEMTQGAESTAGSYAEYVRLAEEYASGDGLQAAGGRLLLPHANVEACKNFITWYATEKNRLLSMESLMRGGEAYVTKTSPAGTPNVFKSPDVKAHLKDLWGKRGTEHVPRTTATSSMLSHSVSTVIPAMWPKGARASHGYLASRWSLECLVEGVAGARVGEAVGGGDFHGLMANNTSIIAHPDFAEQKWSKEVVELKLEHSKTGNPRYLNVAGTTQLSDLPVAASLRSFWREAGIATTVEDIGGARIERPDYWVVRVALAGMSTEGANAQFSRLLRLLSDSAAFAREHARVAISYAKQRKKADGPGSAAKRYVNVAGGRSSSAGVAAAVRALRAAGFGEFVSVVPGPLIRATSGFCVTHMPLSTSSTFKTVKEILTSACRLANEATADPDLDLQGLLEALWTNHSLRRMSDTAARRYMNDVSYGRDRVEPWEIDLLYGWNEAEMSKDMQMHYAKMSLRERIKQARISCMI